MKKMIRSTSLVVACLFLYINRYYSASAFQPPAAVPRHNPHHVTSGRSGDSSRTGASNHQTDKKRHRKNSVSKLCLILQNHQDIMSPPTEDSSRTDRRSFLASSVTACTSFFLMSPMLTTIVDPASAAASATDTVSSADHENAINNNDLTFQLFNPDGSLREGVESEAKFRKLSVDWTGQQVAANQRLVNVNGVDQSSDINSMDSSKQEGDASGIRVTYDLPYKWGNAGSDLYLDRNDNNLKACNRITVYQAPASMVVDDRLLEKAATTGIAKALDVPSDVSAALKSADLIGGKTRIVATTTNGQGQGEQQQKYFDFDMAVAPTVCSSEKGSDASKENLGLGFCPYESIYLISSTIVNGRVYAFVLECDKAQWKRANSDLRKVRSTFTVRSLTV
jgi:hypothetical protein